MKKLGSILLVLAMLFTMLPLQTFAVESDTTMGEDNNAGNTGASLYSWDMYMLSEESYPAIRDYLTSLNITRVYQQLSNRYLARTETADMIARLADDGIETVAVVADRSWGLAENDLSEAKTYMDNLVAYNSGIGAKNPITKIALDIETYTYSDWKDDSVKYFADYIEKMQEVYAYAHSCGFTVIQVIPTHYDTIDADLFREFFTTCADEISLMNYEKATQVTAIQEEIALCEELGMKVETIFETMPRNEYFAVTEENTYFYEGYSALLAKQETILETYTYENLSVSYHHLPTMYHVVTGKYIAEIYAYTDSNDPTKNDLGQTDALKSIILTGSDGSVIEAGLCNPNLGAQHEENCYIAVGVVPGVKYTVSSAAEDYAVTTPAISFSLGEDDVIGYTSISIKRIASETNASLYSWNMYMLSEGSYPAIRDYLTSLNITRVYQQIPEVYLTRTETADMVARLADDGIETVALVGDRAWGLAGNDLSEAKTYMDKLVAYNSGIGAKNPITKIAFDVETYTYSDWEKHSAKYFTAYIGKMKEVYNYAHSCGFTVIQVIPTHYDTISAKLNREFYTTCADEISLMNYEKATQVTAIQEEIALCEELGMKVETIFETMPRNENFSVTEENTYFYEGFSALMAKQKTILETYTYENLSVSYHHFPTMYHVVTGKYIAEIYAYTDDKDPTKNDLGQTDALKSIILTGSDGSVIEAGLCNPNLTAQYAENCYIAVGVVPGVEYTISSAAEDYAVTTPVKTFSFGEDEVIGYTGISIERIASTEHNWVEATEGEHYLAPTCTETGIAYMVCSVCGEVGEGRELPALGHDMVVGTVHPATCTEEGYTEYVCSRCGADDMRDVVPALGHSVVTDEAVPATCTASGLTEGSHCSVCGEVLVAQEVVSATGHNWVEATEGEHYLAPTCTETGIVYMVCSVCGEVGEGIELPALGHDMVAGTVHPATCTEEGYTEYVCSRCGADDMRDVVPALDHSVVTDEAVPATCTASGLTEGSHCSVCGEVLVAQEVVSATGHNWVEATEGEHYLAPTCTETGIAYMVCSVCGEVGEGIELPALGHDMVAGTVHPATCTEEGYTEYVCSRCGADDMRDIVPALGHSYTYADNGDGTHTATCTNEGCTVSEIKEHTFENGICTACGAAEVAEDPYLDTSLVFYSQSLSLESSIKAQFIIRPSNLTGYSDFYVSFNHIDPDGKETTTTDTGYVYYNVFKVYENPVAAKEMSDTIRITLYGYKDGQWYHGQTVEWNIRDALVNGLRNSTKDSYKVLAASILNYGAAAQNFFSYNTDNLANATLTEEELALAITTPDTLQNNGSTSGTAAGVSFVGKTLALESAIETQFIFSSAEYANTQLEAHISYTLNGETKTDVIDGTKLEVVSGKYYTLRYSGIAAKDLRTVVTVTIYDKTTGNTVSQSISYSAETYCYEKLNSTSATAVAKSMCTAVMCYIDAAAAYFG